MQWVLWFVRSQGRREEDFYFEKLETTSKETLSWSCWITWQLCKHEEYRRIDEELIFVEEEVYNKIKNLRRQEIKF